MTLAIDRCIRLESIETPDWRFLADITDICYYPIDGRPVVLYVQTINGNQFALHESIKKDGSWISPQTGISYKIIDIF